METNWKNSEKILKRNVKKLFRNYGRTWNSETFFSDISERNNDYSDNPPWSLIRCHQNIFQERGTSAAKSQYSMLRGSSKLSILLSATYSITCFDNPSGVLLLSLLPVKCAVLPIDRCETVCEVPISSWDYSFYIVEMNYNWDMLTAWKC